MNLQVRDIKALSLLEACDDVDWNEITSACIDCSKLDWDSLETSWDFKYSPLL